MADKVTYEDNGFDNFLSRRASVITETELVGSIRTPQVSAQSLVGNVPDKSIEGQINKTVKRTPLTTVTTASIADNAGTYLNSTIYLNAAPENVMFGICEITAFMDTVASANIVPYGSNAIAAGHRVLAWYDEHRNQVNASPGKFLTYNFLIYNESGSAHTYTYYIKWRYFGDLIFET